MTYLKNSSTVILLLIISFLSTNKLLANDDKILEVKSITEEAYQKFDTNLFLKANGICERILSANPENKHALYYQTYSGYRLLLISMVKKETKLFNLYYDSSLENIKKLKSDPKYLVEANILESAILMMKLAVDNSQGQVLAPKIFSLLGSAEAMDKMNPRTFLIKGQMLVNMPEFFGGSVDKAIENYKKGLELFERQTANKSLYPDWGYIELLTSLGQAYTRKTNYKEAKSAYEKALTVIPDYGFVKHNLMPELEKIKQSN